MVLAAVTVFVPKEREKDPFSLRGGQKMNTGLDRAWSNIIYWKVSLTTAGELEQGESPFQPKPVCGSVIHFKTAWFGLLRPFTISAVFRTVCREENKCIWPVPWERFGEVVPLTGDALLGLAVYSQ